MLSPVSRKASLHSHLTQLHNSTGTQGSQKGIVLLRLYSCVAVFPGTFLQTRPERWEASKPQCRAPQPAALAAPLKSSLSKLCSSTKLLSARYHVQTRGSLPFSSHPLTLFSKISQVCLLCVSSTPQSPGLPRSQAHGATQEKKFDLLSDLGGDIFAAPPAQVSTSANFANFAHFPSQSGKMMLDKKKHTLSGFIVSSPHAFP